MDGLTLELELNGTLQEPVPNLPFSLHDPASVWTIAAGKLDLFIVSIHKGEPSGARSFVGRAEAGDCVFGLPPATGDAVLVATAVPGTRLVVVPESRVRAIIAQGNEEAAALLEGWMSRICHPLLEEQSPGPITYVKPGESVEVDEAPVDLLASRGVVWVAHRKGASHFLSQTDLPPLRSNACFPVSRHVWLRADPGSDCIAWAADDAARQDELWEGWQTFQQAAFFCLLARRSQAIEAERKRLHDQKKSDSSRFRSALLQLAATIKSKRGPGSREEACFDPLYLAVHAIGEEMGMKINPHPDMLRGLQMADPLEGVARASGIRARRVTLKGMWWKKGSGAMLVFRDRDDRPMAVLERGRRHVEIFDPVENRNVTLTAELALELKSTAFVFYRPLPLKPLAAIDLLRFGFRGCERDLLTILLTGVAAGLVGILVPYASGIVFDQYIPGDERTQLLGMCFLLVLAAIISAMFLLVRNFAMLRMEGKIDASLQSALWDRLLGLPTSFFRGFSAGDLAQRSMGIAQIRELLTGTVLTAVLSATFSVFSFLLLFYYSVPLALVAAVLVLTAVSVTACCGMLRIRLQRQFTTLRGEISSKLFQFISGIAKFRVSATEIRAFTTWAKSFAVQKRVATNARHVSNALTVFNAVFPTVCLAVIFYFHSRQLLSASHQSMTTGEFIAFLAAFTQFMLAALGFSSSIVEVAGAVAIYERARPILQTVPEVTEAKADPKILSGAIELSRVRFSYSSDTPPVLRDISLRIEPGEYVALVGPSGCGKSTIFRLLLGFDLPQSGAVYFDRQDLTGLDIQAVRRQIGVVLQSSRPIAGSIFDNIVGSSRLTVDDAWEAARMAGLDEDIRRMPMGLHTYITDGGGGISGGQRQRLMIARAIVARPRILLFDEATSALDNHTQAVVSRSLENLQATRLVIAHRLSTVLGADKIVVLNKGSIVQSGRYQDLIAQDGMFQEMARRQLS